MKAVIFSVAVSGLLLWLVLLRAAVDLFVVVYIPRRNNWAKQTARCLMKCASGPAFYQWKILLDYKSERNVTNHCLNRECNLLFWEVKLFHVRFVTTSASTSKLYAYNTSMGNSKFNVSDASTLFFPDFLRAQNMFRVIEGKLYRNDLRGNKNYFELAGGSSYRG